MGRASNSTRCTLPLIKTCEKSQQTWEADLGYYHAKKGSQQVKINCPWLNSEIVFKHYPRALSQSQVIIFPALESDKVITILDIHQVKKVERVSKGLKCDRAKLHNQYCVPTI
ncbi:hypothetical protein ES319_A07G131100v1 [Gossypium barbadense]|uniref:Uncharacterized protein n=1 Tax=Gossypium barbadense TaxID=3634 RepID=A0A5J5V359_GOSBA|nr:hypothetical protein ES319_A07G131100v1 [Gossypium barbadense]